MYILKIKNGKHSYKTLMRGNFAARFESIFSMRKYFRVYDRTLLRVERYV